MRWWAWVGGTRTVAVTVALLVVSACGGGTDEVADVPVEAPDAPADDQLSGSDETEAVAPPTEVDDSPDRVPALDVTARLLDGGSTDLGAFSGQPVALWMWAPW